MLVITKHAEKRLLNEVQKLKKQGAGHRCFYVSFKKVDLPKKQLFENFLKLLNDLPNSYTAQLYICHDKDVFILMHGFMQRQFTDLLKKLSHELKIKNLEELSKTYEIQAHWGTLHDMCTTKIAEANEAEVEKQEKEQQEKTDNATLKILSEIDVQQVRTIKERRNERNEHLVMIVDDDQLLRTLTGNVLSQDFRLTFAKNGQEALLKFVEMAPDVLFLDIGLPDISGHDVLESIFQIDPEAYVIMFSGRKDKENMMRALNAGAMGFVGKPFTRDKLFHYIQKSPHIREK